MRKKASLPSRPALAREIDRMAKKQTAPADLRLTLPLAERRALERERGSESKRITAEDIGLTPDQARKVLQETAAGDLRAAGEISRRLELLKVARDKPRCCARTAKGKLCNRLATPGRHLCPPHSRERVRAIQRAIEEKKAAARRD